MTSRRINQHQKKTLFFNRQVPVVFEAHTYISLGGPDTMVSRIRTYRSCLCFCCSRACAVVVVAVPDLVVAPPFVVKAPSSWFLFRRRRREREGQPSRRSNPPIKHENRHTITTCQRSNPEQQEQNNQQTATQPTTRNRYIVPDRYCLYRDSTQQPLKSRGRGTTSESLVTFPVSSCLFQQNIAWLASRQPTLVASSL